MSDQSQQQVQSVDQFRRFAMAVCMIGVLVQLGLTAYYLGMGHKAQPHHLPVGLVSPAAKRTAVMGLLARNDYFKVTDYATADDLTIAIKRRDVYGGVDVTGARPHLFVASAAGPAALATYRRGRLPVRSTPPYTSRRLIAIVRSSAVA